AGLTQDGRETTNRSPIEPLSGPGPATTEGPMTQSPARGRTVRLGAAPARRGFGPAALRFGAPRPRGRRERCRTSLAACLRGTAHAGRPYSHRAAPTRAAAVELKGAHRPQTGPTRSRHSATAP